MVAASVEEAVGEEAAHQPGPSSRLPPPMSFVFVCCQTNICLLSEKYNRNKYQNTNQLPWAITSDHHWITIKLGKRS